VEVDPTHFLFTRNSSSATKNGDALFPIVVYRQQVANSAFPRVSGHLLQVTPLIERLAWNFFPAIFGGSVQIPARTVVFDPLIAGGEEIFAGGFNFVAFPNLYLRDQQPVIVGATYQYYVTRMNAKHEVAEIINAGTVTIPPN
jgi:hypothetical protein